MSACRDCVLGVCAVHPKGEGWESDLAFPNLANKRVTIEMTFADVDPELMALLTGTKPDGTVPVNQSMEVHGYHKRKWWQWLLRRPRVPYHYFFPNVKIEPVSRNQKEK